MEFFSTVEPNEVREAFLDLVSSNPPGDMTPAQYRENRERAFDGAANWGSTTLVGARKEGNLVAVAHLHKLKSLSQWHAQDVSGRLDRIDGSPMPSEIADHYGQKTVHVVSYVADPNLSEPEKGAAVEGILGQVKTSFPEVSGITLHTSDNMPPSVRKLVDVSKATVVGVREHQRAREFRFSSFEGDSRDHQKAIQQHRPGTPYKAPEPPAKHALQGIDPPGKDPTSPSVAPAQPTLPLDQRGRETGVEKILGE